MHVVCIVDLVDIHKTLKLNLQTNHCYPWIQGFSLVVELQQGLHALTEKITVKKQCHESKIFLNMNTNL